MLKLNIRLESIKFSNYVVQPNDTIRVSITTVPDRQKKAKIFEVKNIDIATPSFQIKMNDCIQKIIVVFRKKSFFSDGQIIASTVIHRNEMGIFDDVDYSCKKIMIYRPIADSKNLKNREIVGSMEVTFTLKEELQHVHCIVKKDDGKLFSSLKDYFNENENFM